ncbi:hypothetical protein C7475_106368 [Chitinophaga sp. S165]|nr:hypothetical protein C7475_106368 [Chitinophaga sp. S165]
MQVQTNLQELEKRKGRKVFSPASTLYCLVLRPFKLNNLYDYKVIS